MEIMAKRGTGKLPIVFFLLVIVFVAGWLLRDKLNIGIVSTFFTNQYVASVDKTLPSLRKVDVTITGLSAEAAYVTAYDKDGTVQKIVASFASEMAKVDRDYYYDTGELRFVFERATAYESLMEGVERVEESRFSFDRGKMIAWQFGPKKESKKKDDEYTAQEQDILKTSHDVLIALGPRLAYTRVTSQPLAQFLPGRVFVYPCEAGEKGTFRPDGTLQVSLIQAMPGDRNSAVGRWEATDTTLTIFGTTLSDKTYNTFSFEKKGGTIIARALDTGCDLLISSDKQALDDYQRTLWYEFETYVDTLRNFMLTLPQSWKGTYVVSHADTGAIFYYKEEKAQNWLFDIYLEPQEEEGERVLLRADNGVWVGRMRSSVLPAYDGPNKEEFEAMFAGVPGILDSFILLSAPTEE